MEIIPVIDLLHGQVVRAQRGERNRYQPIQSQLCSSSEPMDVASALLELYPFTSLYIADLDAIQNMGDNLAIIERLRTLLPHTKLWVDGGIRQAERSAFRHENFCCVIGSEGLRSLQHYESLKSQLAGQRVALSLDFGHAGLLGPDDLLRNPQQWPHEVIGMILPQVGSYQGPDVARYRALMAMADGKAIYAAGGVRDADDLRKLRELGIAGALIASALHDRRIDRLELAELVG